MYIEVHLIQGMLIAFFYLKDKTWKVDRTVILIMFFSIISDLDFIPFILGLTTRKLFNYALYMPFIIYLILRKTEKYHKTNYKYITFSYIAHMHSDMIGYTPTLYLYPLKYHLPTAPPEIYFNHFFIQFCDTYALMLLLLWLSLSNQNQNKLLKTSTAIYFTALVATAYTILMGNMIFFMATSTIALMHFPFTAYYAAKILNPIQPKHSKNWGIFKYRSHYLVHTVNYCHGE
ncbi:MAG: hypothetical protein B6U95_07065 [Thermofilum sp. ex4484_82]|nr:MAG: hypothetical protein B6U95_07065 [Thermofilum sp. ex4484_82]OYT37279.1 MAG: hypothetical protein B6U96_07060 [Archaeoglobales archaeon ex4484_92]